MRAHEADGNWHTTAVWKGTPGGQAHVHLRQKSMEERGRLESGWKCAFIFIWMFGRAEVRVTSLCYNLVKEKYQQSLL